MLRTVICDPLFIIMADKPRGPKGNLAKHDLTKFRKRLDNHRFSGVLTELPKIAELAQISVSKLCLEIKVSLCYNYMSFETNRK